MPQVLATSDGMKSLYGLGRIGVLPSHPQVAEAGAWKYSLPDGLGSVRQWTDPAGAVLAAQSYGPFGEARDDLSTPPWGFTGEWQDPTCCGTEGMVYLRARWYNPALGRFTQVDPFPGLPSVPGTLHPYAYVLNDPLNDTDPTGEIAPWLAALGISVGVGAVIGAVGGGIGYAIAHPGHSLSEYARDPSFWRSVGSGAAGGAVAGLAVWALPAGSTFWGAVGVGAVSGSLASGATQITENLLTPCTDWREGVPEAMLAGGISGGITGGLSYGIRQLFISAINRGNTTVYRYIQGGKTRYIGQTRNFEQRVAQHLRGRGWVIQRIKGLQHLSPIDARAVEQALIEHYELPNLLNKINSIAESNPIYDTALQRGQDILRLIRF